MTLTLADAIIQEDVSLVRERLYRGVNLNQWDEYGFTPLIEAAITDNYEITRLLLEYRADVNLQDATGSSALHWATENNNIELCRLLLDHGANANAYTFAGQPVLVMPLLRQQTELKKLLSQYGADLEFAQDYINAKLLGHMFELVGKADIVDPKMQFVEVDFEGFYLEFSVAIITEAVAQFQNHYAARQLRRYAPVMSVIVDSLSRAARLIRFQQYRVNLEKNKSTIDALMKEEPLIIPVGYEGHAITFVKFGNIFVKCDRREDSRLYDNVYFYNINRPKNATPEFFKSLMYEKQTDEFINKELHHVLDLQPITELKVPAQISGNCSWANVEACIPVVFFLMCSTANDFQKNISQYKSLALNCFDQWREWNKDRALNFCIQSFRYADSLRRMCKAEILAAILFQACAEDAPKSRERTEIIMGLFANPSYKHILLNYVTAYCYEDYSDKGKYFMSKLKEYGYLDKR